MRIGLLVAALAMATFSGCVHVNLPEHMVGDTVDAGKDAVRAISHKLDVKPTLDTVQKNSRNDTFWLAQQGSADQTVAELQHSCIEALVAEVHLESYRVIEQQVEAKESGIISRCAITTVPAPTARR